MKFVTQPPADSKTPIFSAVRADGYTSTKKKLGWSRNRRAELCASTSIYFPAILGIGR